MAENEREKRTFKEWLENYFYHYKWHTIIALVLVFAIVICSMQMCTKTSFDLHIMYAGSDDIRKTAQEGDISEYQKLLSGIKPYASDVDGDGTVNVNLETLFMPTDEEIKEIESTDGYEVNFSRIAQDTELFKQNIQYGDYYVCLISEHIFIKHTTEYSGVVRFAPISTYAEGNGSVEYANEYGIYLSSLPIYQKPGFNLLSEDTVLCIRKVNFDKNGDDLAVFKNSEDLLRKLILAK